MYSGEEVCRTGILEGLGEGDAGADRIGRANFTISWNQYTLMSTLVSPS